MTKYPGEVTGGIHSDLCRRKICAKLAETLEGRERLKRAETRLGRALVEHAARYGDAVAQGESGQEGERPDHQDAPPSEFVPFDAEESAT